MNTIQELIKKSKQEYEHCYQSAKSFEKGITDLMSKFDENYLKVSNENKRMRSEVEKIDSLLLKFELHGETAPSDLFEKSIEFENRLKANERSLNMFNNLQLIYIDFLNQRLKELYTTKSHLVGLVYANKISLDGLSVHTGQKAIKSKLIKQVADNEQKVIEIEQEISNILDRIKDIKKDRSKSNYDIEQFEGYKETEELLINTYKNRKDACKIVTDEILNKKKDLEQLRKELDELESIRDSLEPELIIDVAQSIYKFNKEVLINPQNEFKDLTRRKLYQKLSKSS